MWRNLHAQILKSRPQKKRVNSGSCLVRLAGASLILGIKANCTAAAAPKISTPSLPARPQLILHTLSTLWCIALRKLLLDLVDPYVDRRSSSTIICLIRRRSAKSRRTRLLARSSLLLSAALLAFWGSNGRSARGCHSSIWLFALTIDTFTCPAIADDEDDPGLLQRLLQQQQRQAASICLACPGGSLVESGFFFSFFCGT